MKKRILALLFAVMLCGCSEDGAKVRFAQRDYETDTEYVSLEIPSVSGFSNQTFEDEINSMYETEFRDCLEDFLAEAEEHSDTRTQKSRLEIKSRVCCNKKPVLSIMNELYVYTDGLHGTNSRVVKNIDLDENRILALSDMFLDAGYHAKLTELVEQILETDSEQYRDLWEKPVLSKEQAFYIEDGDLVLFYPPYELSYYARGFVEFRIPIKDLDGYIKPCYAGIA